MMLTRGAIKDGLFILPAAALAAETSPNNMATVSMLAIYCILSNRIAPHLKRNNSTVAPQKPLTEQGKALQTRQALRDILG
jgi:hypothetical protein